MTGLLEAALSWHDAGACVVPAQTDGSKAPAGLWKAYMEQGPTREQLRAWFQGSDYDGFGLVCGAVSGHLEMFELEGRAVAEGYVERLAQVLSDHGQADLLPRLAAGYLERTPSGGFHWLYRVAGPTRKNLKLARRPSTPDELAAWKDAESVKAAALDEPARTRRLERIAAMQPHELPQVLVETRGQGGFTVIAPSGGRTHPSGAPWQLLSGGPATVPLLSEDERDTLHALAGLLDSLPAEPTREPVAANSGAGAGGERPGDAFNAQASWDSILGDRGWTHVRDFGNARGWRRPGKTEGVSATTGRNNGDNLYVFSSSTEFETERPYSKFAAYALLEHGNDFAAAAKALRAQGFGGTTLRAVDTSSVAGALGLAQPAAAGRVEGALATVHQLEPRQSTGTVVSDAGLTDVGNADLLVERHKHELRYVPERGQWLSWSGSHWSWDNTGHVVEAAKATVLAITDESEDLRKHRTRSLSRRAIDAMIALARSNPAVATPAALLDAHKESLCTPGGVVNLRTGELSPSDPEGLHTRTTSVTPAPGPTPQWDAFLDETFAGDTEMLGFVQRLAGYSCTGDVTHHVLPFLFGSGGNGKSVFLDVMLGLLRDYAAAAPAGFLLAGQQQHETEIARLQGLRLVVCSEVNQESRFDEAKVKILTGGDPLTARFMRQDHFTFQPSHTLWLMGNHQPRIGTGGDSFERRLRLIPFTNKVSDDKKVVGLDRLLLEQEGPGILAWVVEGARLALADGLQTPERVKAATQVYMAEEDALARFVEDRCLLGGGAHVRTNTAAVRRAYTQWCNDEGEKAVSPQVFGRELRTRYGVDQARSHGQRFYTGLDLLKDDTDTADHWANQ